MENVPKLQKCIGQLYGFWQSNLFLIEDYGKVFKLDKLGSYSFRHLNVYEWKIKLIFSYVIFLF